MSRFHFPAWVNTLLPVMAGVIGVGAIYATGLLAYAVHPLTTDVGYRPEQPIPFSHALHAGKLKMDCRYCHTTVDKAAFAAIPPLGTCWNCHAGKSAGGAAPTAVSVHTDSAKLQPLRDAVTNGQQYAWRKVHDLADFAYFNHSVHVNRGVSCVECHGRVDTMEVVEQKKTLSMGFCLTCHRDPAPRLRPVDQVTNLAWAAPEGKPEADAIGAALATSLAIHPKQNCSTCHR